MEISKLGGTFLDRYADTNADVDEEDSIVSPRGSPMIVRVSLISEHLNLLIIKSV